MRDAFNQFQSYGYVAKRSDLPLWSTTTILTEYISAVLISLANIYGKLQGEALIKKIIIKTVCKVEVFHLTNMNKTLRLLN